MTRARKFLFIILAVHFPRESFRGAEWVQSYNKKRDADAQHVFKSSTDVSELVVVTFDSRRCDVGEIGLLHCLFAFSTD